MKKLGLFAAMTVAVLTVGAGSVGAYPGGALVTFSDSTPAPGASFTATFNRCVGTEPVTFEFNGATVTATCGTAAAGFRRVEAPAFGSASATLTAPTVAGTYPVVATGTVSGNTATGTITVTAAAGGGELPATGSDSAPTVQIAAGLVAAGVGLAAVGGIRHRKRSAAA